MTYRIPSDVLVIQTASNQPAVVEDSTRANLTLAGTAGDSVTLGPFLTTYLTQFDMQALLVTGAAPGSVIATLQLQVRALDTDAWADSGGAYNVVENVTLIVNGVTAGNLQAQWVLTMAAGFGPTTALTFTVVQRSN